MPKYLSYQINVSKIDKNRLYVGEKGVYLSGVIVIHDEPDQYNQNGFMTQDITEDERKTGMKSPILGNLKYLPKKEVNEQEKKQAIEDLPF